MSLMSRELIERMLEDCENVRNVEKHNGGPDFSKWELDFLDSAGEQFEESGFLTERQNEKLRQIWEKI